jgi:nucleotidyltransferase AbiEii toxin of type IV toxin-antitoxin system
VITQPGLDQWRVEVPWEAPDIVEQDLVLSRLIIEIANHPMLGDELVFRGGTCFHKVWLDRPWRYSEDLDYVRRTGGGVGKILDALREISDAVGFDRASTDVRRHPKIRLFSTFRSGQPMRIKVEMNTYERSPARSITKIPYRVDNDWFNGHAYVTTFALEELVATKIRALYQRRKGRDLFDMWLAVEEANLAPEAIAAAFGPYRPDGWTPALAMENLAVKLEDTRFTTDLDTLVAVWPDRYTIEAGADVAAAVIAAVTP